MKARIVICIALLLSFSGSAFADKLTRVLSKLEGFTIVAVTQVDGEFKGCEWDRMIRLTNGLVLKCQSYSYSYSYSPDAVVFAKTFKHQGNSFAEVKLLVDGELFDMGLELLKR